MQSNVIRNEPGVPAAKAGQIASPASCKKAVPIEHEIAAVIARTKQEFLIAATYRPDVWMAALKSVGPHLPTQARRSFREFMDWDESERNQAMSALEGAIGWAEQDGGFRLRSLVSEYMLSPQLANALFAHWPSSDLDAVKNQYNAWRNAVNDLVTRYQRLAFKIANQFNASVGGEGDWVSHAFFALIKAAERYDDPTKAEFMTFAYRWIRSELKKVYERDAVIKGLTQFDSDTHNKDRSALIGGQDSLVGLAPGPNQQFVVINRRKEVAAAIDMLTERERLVIGRLYGLGEQDEERSAVEVGQELGVSPNRISQIKTAALAKMQSATV